MDYFNQFREGFKKARNEFMKKEQDAIKYIKDHRITKDKFSKHMNDIKKTSKDTMKYQLKQLPYYTYVVTRTGIKYTYFIGKHALRTPPGRYIKGIGLTYFLGRSIYVYGTHRHKDITVNHKFWRYDDNDMDSKNGYMISDDNGNIYGVRNSIWFLQPYSTELWSEFKENEKYELCTYGIRLAALGIYPNIVRAWKYEEGVKCVNGRGTGNEIWKLYNRFKDSSWEKIRSIGLDSNDSVPKNNQKDTK